MPRAKTATPIATAPKTRRAVAAAPAPVERKRTPVRRKVTTIPAFDATAHYDEIAHMAYLNWLGREGEAGNPEEDWFLAEQSVRAKYAA